MSLLPRRLPGCRRCGGSELSEKDQRSSLLIANAWHPYCAEVSEHSVDATHPGMVAPEVLEFVVKNLLVMGNDQMRENKIRLIIA